MKKSYLKFLITFLAVASIVVYFNGASGFAKKMVNIVTMTWYNFDDINEEGDWNVVGSKFAIQDKITHEYIDYVPNGLGDNKSASKKSLGFHGAFTRKGYNSIDISPKKPKGPFPGQVDSIDMWVWGGNFSYNLEIHVRDYSDYNYQLPMGSLMYYGWRNLTVKIPNTIPQDEPYAPRKKGLTFIKFRTYSDPHERKDRFHCFFDFFKIVTDTYRDQYDGHEIEKLLSKKVEEGPKGDGDNPK